MKKVIYIYFSKSKFLFIAIECGDSWRICNIGRSSSFPDSACLWEEWIDHFEIILKREEWKMEYLYSVYNGSMCTYMMPVI